MPKSALGMSFFAFCYYSSIKFHDMEVDRDYSVFSQCPLQCQVSSYTLPNTSPEIYRVRYFAHELQDLSLFIFFIYSIFLQQQSLLSQLLGVGHMNQKRIMLNQSHR